MTIPAKITFQTTGPFFDMLETFCAALAGLTSLVEPGNPLDLKPGKSSIAWSGKVNNQHHIDVFEVYQRHQSGRSLRHTTQSLCCMLINTSYETVKDKKDYTPEFEFFRHIRNASSHKNLFNFREYGSNQSDWEPKRPASWRGLKIEDSLKGRNNPLYGTQCFFDFIGIGDLPLLLWDIEQKILLQSSP